MDRTDDRRPRRLRINGIALPPTCERCGSTAFEGSTSKGPAALLVNLPMLRCKACQLVYTYNRGAECWEAGAYVDSTIEFVPVEDLDPYIDRWN